MTLKCIAFWRIIGYLWKSLAPMLSSIEKNPRICLVTGPPGCGKTTLLRRAVESLSGVRITGFLTEEIREGGRRQGFMARSLDGASCVMAHRTIKTRDRVGAYGVDLAAFDRVIVGPLESSAEAELYVIDEIGKMELKSTRFQHVVRKVIDGAIPILATIPVASRPVVEELRSRVDTLVIDMGKTSRIQAGNMLGEWLKRFGFAGFDSGE